MKKNKKIVVIFLSILCLVCTSQLAADVFADESLTKASSTDTLRVAITPGTQRTELDPGAVYQNSMTIVNNSDRDVKFHMAIEPYSVEGTDYSPVYTVQSAYTKITNWISFDKNEIEISAHSAGTVNYTVTVPMDAPGGSQYAVLFAETADNADASSVLPSASTGMILIAKISGETREVGEIRDSSIPGFLLSPPVAASALVENSGNVDTEVIISMKIENYFSGDVIYEGDKTPTSNTILPNTSRMIKTSYENVPRLGILKVTQRIEYMGDVDIETRNVIICPIWLIALIVLIILIYFIRIWARKLEEQKTRRNSRNSDGGSGNFNI